MNMTRDRVQSLAWALIVSVSFALLLVLTFKVNAVKSEVRLMDRKILSLKQEKVLLETEFQTRSNQHELAGLNDVDLGLKAPTASQYINGERQLASLSKPETIEAPSPILMASAEVPPATRPAATGGMLPAVFSTAPRKALGDASSTRLLAQHGEHVAPGGKERFEKTLALASAGDPPAFAVHRKAPLAGPPAASASFLAAATGSDRPRKAETSAGLSPKAARPAAMLAEAKPAHKPTTVADAFGGDWLRQVPAAPKGAAAAKAKSAHRRIAIEDVSGAANQ